MNKLTFLQVFRPAISVAVFLAAIGAAISFALASDPRNIEIAHLFFLLAWVAAVGCAANLITSSNLPRRAAITTFVVVTVTVAAIAFVCARWVQANYHDASHVAEMKDLYVRFVQLGKKREQAYTELMFAENQAAVDELDANNVDRFPQIQWQHIETKARDGQAKLEAKRLNAEALDEQMTTLLGRIKVEFPSTAEMNTLLEKASAHPTYYPTLLTREDIPTLFPHETQRVDEWTQLQSQFATASIRNQLVDPQNKLQEYLQDQITEIESMSHQ